MLVRNGNILEGRVCSSPRTQIPPGSSSPVQEVHKEVKLHCKPPTTAIPATKLQNCPGGSAATAWHEIHAVTPRLQLGSEVISSVDSPQIGGTGHLITANRLSQG